MATGKPVTIAVYHKDAELIAACKAFGASVIETGEHPCGTCRVSEAAFRLDAVNSTTIVNVQADEPLLDVQKIVDSIEPSRNVLTFSTPQTRPDSRRVRVVSSKNAPPHFTRATPDAEYTVHLGVYVYDMYTLVECAEDNRRHSGVFPEELEQTVWSTPITVQTIAFSDGEPLKIDTMEDYQEMQSYLC